MLRVKRRYRAQGVQGLKSYWCPRAKEIKEQQGLRSPTDAKGSTGQQGAIGTNKGQKVTLVPQVQRSKR